MSCLKDRRPTPFGVNISGYLKGEFGVAEAARASIQSMRAAQVHHVLNIAQTHVHRHEDNMVDGFSESQNPYRVNLVHVNADESH